MAEGDDSSKKAAAAAVDDIDEEPVSAATAEKGSIPQTKSEADAAAAESGDVDPRLAEVCSKSPPMLRFHSGFLREITCDMRQIEDMLHAAAAMAVVYRSSLSDDTAVVASGSAGPVAMIAVAKKAMKELFRKVYDGSVKPIPGLLNVKTSADRKTWEVLEPTAVAMRDQ